MCVVLLRDFFRTLFDERRGEVEGGGGDVDVLFDLGDYHQVVGPEDALGLHLQDDALPDPVLAGDRAEQRLVFVGVDNKCSLSR